MNDIVIRGLAIVAIFASVFLISQVSIGSALNRQAKARAINERLRLLKAGADRNEISQYFRKSAPLFLSEDASYLDQLKVSIQRTFLAAGVPGNPRRLMLICAGLMAMVTSMLSIFAWSSGLQMTSGVALFIVCAGLAIAIGLPWMVIDRMAQRRRKRMEEQFPVALDIFTRALRAGHPIAAAISLLTEELEDPLGSEFGLVADEVAYGADLTYALLAMAERWDMEDIRMFVVSLSVQNETGGNLAEILGNLSEVIRSRASMYMKVRALSSEGRMSALMLTALPILTLTVILIVNRTSILGWRMIVYSQ